MSSNDIPRRTLVIFWEGTANPIDPITTQIGVFAQVANAQRIYSPSQVPPGRGTLKLCFDGCGVTHGNMGVLFARGLDEQGDLAIAIIQEMLRQQTAEQQLPFAQESSSSHNHDGIHVVAVGLSRGGVACMKLAQKLAKNFTADEVTASMLLFDPVPGNAVSTGFPWTASHSQDLSACHNLQRVLAIYPYEALPDLAMHAPSLCIYPPSTMVQEDVTLGCHQGALFMTSPSPRNPYELASNFSMRRLVDFLKLEGVSCSLVGSPFYVPPVEVCVQRMDKELRRHRERDTAKRIAHDPTGLARLIIRHKYLSSDTIPPFLNKHHEQLTKCLRKGTDSSTIEAVYGKQEQEKDKQQSSKEPRYFQLEIDSGRVTCTSRLWR